ncbi:MAG: DEAD/DEAH box helicase [Methylococcales bacterium]|nr:DEAD/DEAH box helicase [Methylococcales bacterium]MBT7443456.1 DEAD/DEAH box helicase [Methylococcales bacterium]
MKKQYGSLQTTSESNQKAKMLTLRDYQQRIIQQTLKYVRSTAEPGVIELSVGGGKTLIISHLARHVVSKGGKVVCLAHTKELVEGAFQTFTRYAPDIPCGIFSASLNKKEAQFPVTYCSEKSLLNALEQFQSIDLLVIDEAHRVNDSADASCYMQIIKHFMQHNPKLRVLGLTGTSYRMSTGSIVGKQRFFKKLIASVGVAELVQKGFLTQPVAPTDDLTSYDFSELTPNTGQYNTEELNKATSDHRLSKRIIKDVVTRTQNRNKVLVFASTLQHAKEIREYLPPNNTGYLDGTLNKEARERVLKYFSDGTIKYLVNKDILTTGYDEPSIDAIAILRPTESKGLLVQMIGRVLRLHSSKKDALVLDYAHNFYQHGSLEELFSYRGSQAQETSSNSDNDEETLTCPDCGKFNNPMARRCTCGCFFVYKICPQCSTQNDITSHHCRECDQELIDPNKRLSLRPNQSGEMIDEVLRMDFSTHTKTITTLKITYHTLHKREVIQYLTPQSNYLRSFANQFVSNPLQQAKVMRMDADTLANHRELFDTPNKITFRKDGKFFKILGWEE